MSKNTNCHTEGGQKSQKKWVCYHNYKSFDLAIPNKISARLFEHLCECLCITYLWFVRMFECVCARACVCMYVGNAYSSMKVRVIITEVLSTYWKTSFDMAVVEINKNFCVIWLGQLFGRLTVSDPFSYFYKGVSVP